MNSNNKRSTNVSHLRANKFQRQVANSNNNNVSKCEKFTNTTDELYECKKCKERELLFTNFDDTLQNIVDNGNVLINYVKAINYINACHDVINAVQKKTKSNCNDNKIDCFNNNGDDENDCEIRMPDLPNFLNLCVPLMTCNKIRSETKCEKTTSDDNYPIKQLIKEEKNRVIPQPNQEQFLQLDETMRDHIEDMYVKEIRNIGKQNLMKRCMDDVKVNVEPVTLLMDEVCNLTDIPSQENIRDETKTKSNGSALTRDNVTYEEYDFADNDEGVETIVTNYEMTVTSDNKYKEDDKRYRCKTPIKLNTNGEKEEDDLSRYNVMSKLEKMQTQSKRREITKLCEDDKFDVTSDSLPRSVYANRSAHNLNATAVMDNRKLSAPVFTNNKEQSWSTKNAIKLQLKHNKNNQQQGVASFNNNRQIANVKEYECNRVEVASQIKSNSHNNNNNNNAPSIKLNKSLRSPQCFNSEGQRNDLQSNRNVYVQKRENSTMAKNNSRFANTNNNNNNNNNNKHDGINKQVKLNHNRDNNDNNREVNKEVINRLPSKRIDTNQFNKNLYDDVISNDNNNNNNNTLVLYKVETKPNDFFTEPRRNKRRKSNNVENYDVDVCKQEEFYTDSDLDEDHFDNEHEIECSNNNVNYD